MATSSNRASPSPHHHQPHFTPVSQIEEGNDDEEGRTSFRATSDYSTPFSDKKSSSSKKRQENDDTSGVSCNKCRPSSRDKFSVVPFENHRLSSASPTPNGIFKFIFTSHKKSPRPPSESPAAASREEHWKIVVAELSSKLIHASKKRDDAVVESAKLKQSTAELEKKLNKLEIYCHALNSGLQGCNGSAAAKFSKLDCRVGDERKVIEHFLVSVSETRSSIRSLSRALSIQLRQIGGKVYDRIYFLLQPYDIKVPFSRNPRGLLFYLEALLNRAFFEEFETAGFHKSASTPVLNPVDRCESNFAMFTRLQGLTWEQVLNKGTKHFSEDFSKFCDRKMSEVVAMLGWTRAWPEPLLQAFFGASKAVWLVHLLANSVHPGLPIFRVDNGVRFDPVYMEDMGGDKAKKLVPTIVRIMVTPGFYVYDNVVKCKVLCRYCNSYSGGNVNDLYDKGFTPSPT